MPTRGLQVRHLVAIALISGALGCDHNPEGPSAPERPEGGKLPAPRAPGKTESRPVRVFD